MFEQADDNGQEWQAEIKVAGTVYIKAESAEDAAAKFKEWQNGEGMETAGFMLGDSDHPISDDISLSPAMTSYGPWGSGSDITLSREQAAVLADWLAGWTDAESPGCEGETFTALCEIEAALGVALRG